MSKKILVLYPNDWDRGELTNLRGRTDIEFVYLGKELFKFPGVLALPFLNVERFLRHILKTIQKENVDGVLSSDEYIGAILSALAAEKAGLPGNRGERIILAQHKYLSRELQQEVCPEAAVNANLIPLQPPLDYRPELPFPFFVKPVKGTFSLFAKKVASMEELRKHLGLNMLERRLWKIFTGPYNDLLEKYGNLTYNANFFVGEELIEGVQVTVDGFAWEGEVTIMGIIDSVMYPGTGSFERFEYPSRLPLTVQERINLIVRKLILGFDYQNGQFNVELFFNQETDQIRIIEINPRLSYQFADLYENVDGTNSYEVLVSLTLGQKPDFIKNRGAFRFASSFVLRNFKGKKLTAVPDSAEVERFNQKYTESRIKIYGKKGHSMKGEMRAGGSYRYCIVNVGAGSLLDLFAIYEDAVELLEFRFA